MCETKNSRNPVVENGSLIDDSTKINKTDNIRIILENNWIQISVKYNNKIYKY